MHHPPGLQVFFLVQFYPLPKRGKSAERKRKRDRGEDKISFDDDGGDFFLKKRIYMMLHLRVPSKQWDVDCVRLSRCMAGPFPMPCTQPEAKLSHLLFRLQRRLAENLISASLQKLQLILLFSMRLKLRPGWVGRGGKRGWQNVT